MSERIERVFRDRRLSPEEVAEDNRVRRQVEQEYPPSPPVKQAAGRISESLRESIRASGKTVDEVSAAAHVSPAVVTQFLGGQRDIHLATADRIAETLGLTLATQVQ